MSELGLYALRNFSTSNLNTGVRPRASAASRSLASRLRSTLFGSVGGDYQNAKTRAATWTLLQRAKQQEFLQLQPFSQLLMRPLSGGHEVVLPSASEFVIAEMSKTRCASRPIRRSSGLVPGQIRFVVPNARAIAKNESLDWTGASQKAKLNQQLSIFRK